MIRLKSGHKREIVISVDLGVVADLSVNLMSVSYWLQEVKQQS